MIWFKRRKPKPSPEPELDAFLANLQSAIQTEHDQWAAQVTEKVDGIIERSEAMEQELVDRLVLGCVQYDYFDGGRTGVQEMAAGHEQISLALTRAQQWIANHEARDA